jgi:succinoglycan biosynthesis protein ExoA
MKRISVIVPMLNEAAHVERFVADVAGQDFRGELEVIVADGGSTDGSVDKLRAAAEQAELAITILENPSSWVSRGLNACIAHATGELLVRLDCHSRYPANYLSRCAAVSEETGAEAVGGIVVPQGRTPGERAVACAMASPFGGIGWMRNSTGETRRDSDTVTYGSFRPEAFRRAGLFDESLRRNQDDEFAFRLRRAGGRVVLDSSIRVYYTPRDSYADVFRQYFAYGRWKVPVMLKHRRVLSLRSMAPPALVLSLAVVAPLAPLSVVPRRLLAALLAPYVGSSAAFAALSIHRGHESWRLLPRTMGVFPVFHFAYGLGMVSSAARAALRRSFLPAERPTARIASGDAVAEERGEVPVAR